MARRWADVRILTAGLLSLSLPLFLVERFHPWDKVQLHSEVRAVFSGVLPFSSPAPVRSCTPSVLALSCHLSSTQNVPRPFSYGATGGEMLWKGCLSKAKLGVCREGFFLAYPVMSFETDDFKGLWKAGALADSTVSVQALGRAGSGGERSRRRQTGGDVVVS